MYVYMYTIYICMYACTYMRLYVCMYMNIYVLSVFVYYRCHRYVSKLNSNCNNHEIVPEKTHTSAQMYVCMYVCIHVHVYVSYVYNSLACLLRLLGRPNKAQNGSLALDESSPAAKLKLWITFSGGCAAE